MNLEAYLKRINYSGDLTPSITILKQLQKTHLLNVPFENLDIHYGHPIELDLDKIYHKIVVRKRGGFCYELNGLFQNMLNIIGFDSKIISARVYDNKKEIIEWQILDTTTAYNDLKVQQQNHHSSKAFPNQNTSNFQ